LRVCAPFQARVGEKRKKKKCRKGKLSFKRREESEPGLGKGWNIQGVTGKRKTGNIIPGPGGGWPARLQKTFQKKKEKKIVGRHLKGSPETANRSDPLSPLNRLRGRKGFRRRKGETCTLSENPGKATPYLKGARGRSKKRGTLGGRKRGWRNTPNGRKTHNH